MTIFSEVLKNYDLRKTSHDNLVKYVLLLLKTADNKEKIIELQKQQVSYWKDKVKKGDKE